MTISAKGAERLMTLLVAVSMSLLMSVAMLLFNMGLTPDFLLMWMKNWVVATAVAYPAALVVVPFARRVTGQMT